MSVQKQNLTETIQNITQAIGTGAIQPDADLVLAIEQLYQQVSNLSAEYSKFSEHAFFTSITNIRHTSFDNFEVMLLQYLQTASTHLKASSGIISHCNQNRAMVLASLGPKELTAQLGETYPHPEELHTSFLNEIQNTGAASVKVLHQYQHPVMQFCQVLYIAPIVIRGHLYGTIEISLKCANKEAFFSFLPRLLMFMCREVSNMIQEKLERQERNKIEANLLAQHDQFKVLISNLPGAVYRRDADIGGIMDFISYGIVELTGYESSYFTGKPISRFLNLIHPDDQRYFQGELQKQLTNGDRYVLEYRILNNTRQERWLSVRGQIFYSEFSKSKYMVGVLLDVTDRKVAEQALAKSEEQHRLLAENSVDLIVKMHPDGQLIYVSPAATSLTQYTPEELKGKKIQQFVDPSDWKMVLRRLNQASKDVRLNTLTFRLKQKTGEKLWVEASSKFVFDSQGQLSEIISVVRDVTIRRRTAQALKSSEERYRLLAQNATDSIALFTQNLTVTYASPATAVLIGLEPDFDKQLKWLDWVVETDKQQLINKLNALTNLASNLISVAYRITKPVGTVVWLETTFKVFQQQPLVFIGVSRDITERKLAENEAVETRQQLQYIFDNLGNVFLSVNRKTNAIIQISASCANLFGINQQGFYKNPDVWVQQIKQLNNDKNPDASSIMEFLKTEKKISFSFLIQTPNSQNKWVNAEIKNEFGPNNQWLRMDAIFTDITETRKQADIIKAKEIAEKSLVAKSAFLANISHEFRTPLNGIIGMADLLSMQISKPEHKEMVNIIKESGSNLLFIINDILELSRLEAGKLTLKKNPVNLPELTKVVISLLKPMAIKKNLNILTSVAEGVSEWVVTDGLKLNQVLTNLLSNAIKFTHQGTVCIKYMPYGSNPNLLKVEVTDTGIGIAEEDQELLFENFSQVDTGSNREFEGSGLGLSISKQLVQLMGGDIGLQSIKGKGSTFWFFIEAPAIAPNQITHAPQTPKDLKDLPKTGIRVLVVEDKKVNRQVVGLMLEQLGCQITQAINGDQAIALFEPSKFDVILLDIQMPGKDGYQTLTELQKNNNLPPVVALTAGMPQKPELFAASLPKPVTLHSIFNVFGKLKLLNQHPTPSTKPNNNTAALNLNTLNQIITLSGGNHQLVKEMADSFVEDAQQLIEQINKTYLNNPVELKANLHTLKGLCGTIGAQLLQKACKKTEQNTEIDLKENIEEINTIFKNTIIEIRNFFN